MINLRSLRLFLLFLPGGARRSIRIDGSHRDAQQQNNTLANSAGASSGAREALIPWGLATGVFRRQGLQAGALSEGSKQNGRRAGHLEPPRVAPRFRSGSHRATVTLQAGGGPEEDRLPSKPTRRALLSSAAAASGLLYRAPAHADAGASANLAVPALVPSPFKPTGEMARYCEVVALGREDVCLERKKLLTAYDDLRLDKATAALDEEISYGDARKQLQPAFAAVNALIPKIRSNDFTEIAEWIGANGAGLETLLAQVAGEDAALRDRAGAMSKSLRALATACKAGDASAAARALITLADQLVKFADAT